MKSVARVVKKRLNENRIIDEKERPAKVSGN